MLEEFECCKKGKIIKSGLEEDSMSSRPVDPNDGPRSKMPGPRTDDDWNSVDDLLDGKEDLLVSMGFGALSVFSASAAQNLYSQGNEATYLTALATVGSVYAYGHFLDEYFSE